jgi:hypothetical protein
LASDWYWEQDENGHFTQVSGPVLDMLGIRTHGHDGSPFFNNTLDATVSDGEVDGWNAAERAQLHASIAARQPFIDFALSRTHLDGSQQHYRVSGEPVFDQSCRFIGYRGIGVEYMLKVDSNPVSVNKQPL